MQNVIKEFVSQILLRLDRLLGTPLPLVSVLCYHSISNDNTIVDVKISEFQKQMRYLSNHFEFVTLQQVVDHIKGKTLITRPSIVLTFDDGYQDLITIAKPILDRYNAKATVFVIVDHAKANREEMANQKRLLSWEDISYLQESGWEIGCHTMTHVDLTQQSLNNLDYEIIVAKEVLSKKLGKPIKFFAYPKGLYDYKVLQITKKAEFEGAVTTTTNIISYQSELMQIPRICVDRTHTLTQFKVLLSKMGIEYMGSKYLWQVYDIAYKSNN
jgi:peptidoglycan/xylan/chitin deacetylase (PgdA/CDA1 family)